MESPNANPIDAVRALYEARPYPSLGYLSPFLQRVRWEERPTLNYRAAYAASFGSTAGAARRPRILVAGCGTFEPVVVALANPGAEILAVDISAKSLEQLRWQLRCRGLADRVRLWRGDLERIPESEGAFDLIVATGVLHHLENPERGLNALEAIAGDRAVFRFMIYSYWGRALLYGAKELAASLGADSPAKVRRMMESLPPNHPYRIYFHLYDDAHEDAGLADGYLHPCDQPFSASSLGAFLERQGLEATLFLHGPEGQPQAANLFARFPEEASPWERMALLELFGELQENFRFFARRAFAEPCVGGCGWEWNEALPPRGELFARMAGKKLAFDRSRDPATLPVAQARELQRALFLIPGSGK
jgi:SAM-dependent methyltransferase